METRDPFETECLQIASLASGMRGKARILSHTRAITLADVDLHRATLSLRNALDDVERLIADRPHTREAAE